MGRGISTRGILQLSEVPTRPQVNLLQLPFVEGGALEISWDDRNATIQVLHGNPATYPVIFSTSRMELTRWLFALWSGFETLTDAAPFGPFTLVLHLESDLPTLLIEGGRLAGTVTSWGELHKFLKDARSAGIL